MPVIFVNNFSTTLGSALASSSAGTTGASLVVASTFGAQFPAVVAPNVAYLTITEGTNIEIVLVTAHAAGNDTFTVTRGFEGVGTAAATAVAYTTAAKVECRLTKTALDAFSQPDEAETVSGVKTFTAANTHSALETFSAGIDVTAGNLKLGTTNLLELADQASNPTPIASKNLVYSRNYGGRRLPKWMAPTGIDYFVQDALWESNTILWKPGTASAMTFLGDTPTVTGTFTTTTPAAGSFGAEMRRTNMPTTATISTSVGLLGSTAQFARIAASGHGGFFIFCRFRLEVVAATNALRFFAGLSSIAALPTTVEPSAQAASQIGIGWDSTDTTTAQIMRKDGTTAQKISVTGSTKVVGNTYDFIAFCPPGTGSAGNIFYRVDDVNAGTTLVSDVTTGVSTNAPLASTMMRPVIYVGNATAAINTVSISNFYVSSDY